MTLDDFYFLMIFGPLHISTDELMWWYSELKITGTALDHLLAYK